MSTVRSSCRAGLLLAAVLCCALPAGAQIEPSAEVLVPYFSIDLLDPLQGDDTLFAVTNHGPQTADVVFTLFTNWGIPVLEVHKGFAADEVKSVNLRHWVVDGTLPDRQLSPEELADLQAKLSGRQSPHDGLFYGSEVRPELAVGYVTIRTVGPQRPASLWGDVFVSKPKESVFQADTLVNIDAHQSGNAPCALYGIRFLESGYFERGTHLVIWSPKLGLPSPTATVPEWLRLTVTLEAYDEEGRHVEDRVLSLLPVQVLELHELEPPLLLPYGWLEISLETAGFVGGDYNVGDRISAGLHGYCLPKDVPAIGARVRLEKLVNGQDADLPPGPIVPVGSTLVWTYEVANVGSEPLYGLAVTDDGRLIDCPQQELQPGESFSCAATGAAQGCQHSNEGKVTGYADSGPVDHRDLAYYFGQYQPALAFGAVTVNGEDARTAPGPAFPYGAKLAWSVELVNPGNAPLSNVTVHGGLPVTCPKTALDPKESMLCAAFGVAEVGNQSVAFAAEGTAPCKGGGGPVVAQVAGYYQGLAPPAGIAIHKLTNGEAGDQGTGPVLVAGTPVEWTYVVTNVGEAVLANVGVVDDQGPDVVCPQAVLQPGESMTCSAGGTVHPGQYRNVGTASGTPPIGPAVTASDSSQYYGAAYGITLEKLVNGMAADEPPGPRLIVGTPLLWTYVVTNTGDMTLDPVEVTDPDVVLSCPQTALAPGEMMTCTASGTVASGPHTNVGTVIGFWNDQGGSVTASDPASYTGIVVQLTLEKRVNGEEADVPPGPMLRVGDAVAWGYEVVNSGEVALSVVVTDDHGVAVSCPKAVLEPGESMTCTGSGTASAGQYANVGTATGTAAGLGTVTASDPAHYFGYTAAITIEKLVNGEEADTPPGPTITVGSAVLWTYVVTNAGDVTLTNVSVTDDRGVAVTCPKTTLAAAESMTCTATGTAVVGQYVNLGTVTGQPPAGLPVTASDPAHYLGWNPGNQGCTPGYWKNHTGSWPPAGYSTGQQVDTVFPNVDTYYPSLGNSNLLSALSFAGGPGASGAAEILLRAGVAALLNAAHPDVAYPRSEAAVIADVDAALLENRDTMLALAALLDADNNLGCPLH